MSVSKRTLPEHLRRHPNWGLALKLLQEILPDAMGFDPGDLPGIDRAVWRSVDLDGPDAVVARRVVAMTGLPVSRLYLVVTFASYLRNAGPFFVLQEDLDTFIEHHASLFDDLLFSTDALLVSLDSGVAVVVTHDGRVAQFAGLPWNGTFPD